MSVERQIQPQIREQMCLETHFQYEFSILGHFGKSGSREKKNPNCHKYATFEASFLCFHWQIFLKIQKHLHGKVRWFKAKKRWQFLHKKIIKNQK